jgi:hypothetical protein
MRIPFTAAALMFTALVAPGAALADVTVVDFEALLAPTMAYSVSGVTFTTGAGGLLSPVDGPNGTRVAIGNVNEPNPDEFVFDTIRADFSGVMGQVSVDLGDWPSVEFGDEDLLFLEIYGALDVFLGRTELLIGPLEPNFQTLSIAGPGIKYAVFGAQSATGSSVYADNFTFDTTVPEPGTWALMIAGFGGAGAMLRRRRNAPA